MSEPKKSSNVIPIDAREIAGDRKSVSRRQLINRLNFVNFQDRTITARLRHFDFPEAEDVPVKPQPCADDVLECLWKTPELRSRHLNGWTLQEMDIDLGRHRITFTPEVLGFGDRGLQVRLPDSAWMYCVEEETRHDCSGVQAQLIQHSAHFVGELMSFNASGFQIGLTVEPPQTFGWIDPDNPVHVILGREQSTLYTSECRILDHRIRGNRGRFSLEPKADRLRRYGNKEFRSERHRLVPTPTLLFRHPFSGDFVQREVIDLSGSGFSVTEDAANSVLLPGLILPSLELNFVGTFRLSCKAQVVYRLPFSKGGKRFRCGLALLDIGIEDHTKLLALLSNVGNRNCYICNRVDLDALWDFFFESGFIYPQKYLYIQSNKEKIKATYDRLYNHNSTVARHFTYQEGTRILGHIAMLRFYTNAWLIHHHAGNTAASTRAGLEVLNQIGHFSYECHRLHAIHMKYLICYYRPDNKFPSRVFGRITRNIDDLRGSSIDAFAYSHYRRNPVDGFSMPEGWTLEESDRDDLKALSHFYEQQSNGLMLEALDLKPDCFDISELSREYRRLGFRRERLLFSLKDGGRLRALVAVNLAEIGLNLSELTSAVNVFFLEADRLTKDSLDRILFHIGELYQMEEIPVLLYPAASAEKLSCPVEKFYNLWVMNTDFSDHYFRHLNRMLRFVR